MGLLAIDGADLESYIRDGDGPLLFLDAHAHPWLTTQAAADAAAGRPTAVIARQRTPIVDAASLVFPLASWAETEGTYTSSTGIVQLARRALAPVGQARPAWEIMHRLAVHLGQERKRAVSPRLLFAEMAEDISAFSGMTYGRLLTEPGMPVHVEVPGVG
jgi:NADH dehydrogenase/NADH:ubiquinone oxidoreductase subunit G